MRASLSRRKKTGKCGNFEKTGGLPDLEKILTFYRFFLLLLTYLSWFFKDPRHPVGTCLGFAAPQRLPWPCPLCRHLSWRRVCLDNSYSGILAQSNTESNEEKIDMLLTNIDQGIDEAEYGGAWELTKEGFLTSAAGFLVTWIIVYTGLHID